MSSGENGYTFRMGDHEMTMRDSFSSMLNDKQLTDCVVVIPKTQLNNSSNDTETHETNALTNGHNSSASKSSTRTQSQRNESSNSHLIRTHRVILSASSDFFRSIFSSTNYLNNGVIAVIINNVEFEDMDSIIDFIYRGQVSVGQSRIHKFLAAAQSLMVKGLMNIKLVSNDNQPIDDISNDHEIIRLKNDKRLLELEVKTLKDNEKHKVRDVEEEVRKKLDSERSGLNEARKRFEAEKMKFIIEKEVFEKIKDNQNKQILMQNSDSSKGESSQKVSEERSESQSPSKTSQVIKNIAQQSPLQTPLQTPLQSTPIQTPLHASQTPKSSDSSAKKISISIESPNESEGRQLRKRKLVIDETQDRGNSRSVDISKIEEDEDGEIFEMDFTNLEPTQTQETTVGEARQRFSAALGSGNANHNNETISTNINNTSVSPSSRAIVASTLAYHHSMSGVSQSSTPQMNTTRNLRHRSTSSHGSASTQSMSGENGNEGNTSTERKKGHPGRPPNWAKEVESSEEGTPETRTRKQRISAGILGPRHDSGLYSCPYCPQVYHANQSMQDHINGVHLKQQQQYICDFCGKVYTWRISLNKHLKTVHPTEQALER